MSRILTTALLVLTLSAPALADSLPAGAKLWQDRPTGVGKPDAVSCYEVVKTGTRTRNLQCARNSYWARLNRPFPNDLDVQLQIQRQLTSR
jgi:hypothetical protein